MSRKQEIETRLEQAFGAARIEVRDDSARHKGHAGAPEEGESHFHVVLSTPAFEGVSRIGRHRMVHDALGRDLMGQIHALSMDLSV